MLRAWSCSAGCVSWQQGSEPRTYVIRPEIYEAAVSHIRRVSWLVAAKSSDPRSLVAGPRLLESRDEVGGYERDEVDVQNPRMKKACRDRIEPTGPWLRDPQGSAS